jgi:hypothetical protein
MATGVEDDMVRSALHKAAKNVRDSVDVKSQPPLKRRRQEEGLRSGQVSIRPLEEHQSSVANFWNYYVQELRPLEQAGSSWRAGNAQVRDAFNFRLFLVRAVVALWHHGEAVAVQRLQQRLDNAGSWKKLKKQLEAEQPSGPVRDALNDQLKQIEPRGV